MKVSIGKNTLGGGKKMTTRLNNYNRSTHDLSNVIRTSMAPGVLVPTLKQLLLPGDTFPIQTRCHTLTHPTIGPLFGSFKQQNDFFFCPIRLYNAMLHNNALNIGLNMKQVKFPMINLLTRLITDGSYLPGSGETLYNIINPSSLPSYLGIKSVRSHETTTGNASIQALPYLMYFDIFKNYYANKQEKNFYTIGAYGSYIYKQATTAISGEGEFTLKAGLMTNNKYNLPRKSLTNKDNSQNIQEALTSGQRMDLLIIIIPSKKNNAVLLDTIINLDITRNILSDQEGSLSGKTRTKFYNTISELLKNGQITELSSALIENPIANAKYYKIEGSGFSYNSLMTYKPIYIINKRAEIINEALRYNNYPLTDIDEMREEILAAGRAQYNVNSTFITDIFDIYEGTYGKTINANQPMVGLALKTYQSDINTNWVNTEWIDGDTGINAITAIDTSEGSFTLDTLNLAKKVYTMLNRIAVSDGSYNAWIQTVYTSGGLNHIETPIYLGGSSLEIEFQEVINNSGTEDQPLGTLAGRGIATSHKGGNIIFKADEPGYIFCITSITPRVDYFQGDDWDTYLNTMDDLHKPQLDGIGFQDRLYRNLNSNTNVTDYKKSIGKQPAWIEYMTNINRTYGNFALIENEGWMCLNRIFGEADSYTTYIFPHLYNNIFADTDVTAQNFWVQIAFNIKPRRVMSAKVIPNI
nr:MAG TPA: Major capsid protein [Microviridae sp.]